MSKFIEKVSTASAFSQPSDYNVVALTEDEEDVIYGMRPNTYVRYDEDLVERIYETSNIASSMFSQPSKIAYFKTPYCTPSTLAASAFANLTQLKKAVIQSGVTTVTNSAFMGCTNLTTVVMSVGVSSIGDNAFKNCSKLADIKYSGTKANWETVTKGTDWAEGTSSGLTISCTDGFVNI